MQAVSAPLVVVRMGVAEEDNVGWVEVLGGALVLGGHHHAVLEDFCHAVEVITAVSCRAGDVKDDDALLVVGVGHILQAARQQNSSMLQH